MSTTYTEGMTNNANQMQPFTGALQGYTSVLESSTNVATEIACSSHRPSSLNHQQQGADYTVSTNP